MVRNTTLEADNTLETYVHMHELFNEGSCVGASEHASRYVAPEKKLKCQ